MFRRSERSPGLKVRVSHEATRLSQAHVAAAFDRLVPTLERQTCLPCAEGDKHAGDAKRKGAKPMSKLVATRDVTDLPVSRAGARRQ